MLDTPTTIVIVTDDEVTLLADARRTLKAIAKRATDKAFAREEPKGDNVYPAYQLGRLVGLTDTAGDAIFDVMNNAHNGFDVPISDDDLFAR